LFAVAADPQIWAVHPAHDRWQEPVFRRYFDDALASGGSLTVRERGSGRIIGASRYRAHDDDPRRCEIGWTFLSRDHWGGTTNREMKALMLRHLMQHFQIATFMIGEDNLRSRRAIEKIGGVLSEATETRTMAGREVRHVVYEIGAEAAIVADYS
jgi:RimJ/RimL family protein N-acetyltransferase